MTVSTTEITFRSDMTVRPVQHMGDEKLIVEAAQLSTLGKGIRIKEVTDPARFVRWLMREKHGSPFEHVVFTFYLEVPIFVSRQVVKYRISSINEESGRYKELEPVFYVVPPERPIVQVGKTGDYKFVHDEGKNRNKAARQKRRAERWYTEYQMDLEDGFAKEVSRMETPVNLYSSMMVTMNLRSWLHFCAQRATDAPSHGQWEIAQVADQVGEYLKSVVPNVWDEFVARGYEKP